MRALLISILIGTLPLSAFADVNVISPRAWMESVAPKIANAGETVTRDRLEKQIETQNFHAFLSKVDSDHGFNWNADFLLGTQELSGWRVTGVVEDFITQDEAVEAVHYRHDQDDESIVRYRLVKEHGAWKIDDAMFGADWRSIRYEMTKAVEPH